MGREVEPTAEFTWKSKAPLRYRFFLWLAVHTRCWTSDRLARKGLLHQPACPFCDQVAETINHILLNCVFARTLWFVVLSALGNLEWMPVGVKTGGSCVGGPELCV